MERGSRPFRLGFIDDRAPGGRGTGASGLDCGGHCGGGARGAGCSQNRVQLILLRLAALPLPGLLVLNSAVGLVMWLQLRPPLGPLGLGLLAVFGAFCRLTAAAMVNYLVGRLG